jgi:tyrosyl-tRNA synthetase
MLNVHLVDRNSLSEDCTVLDLLIQTHIRPTASQVLKLIKQHALRVNEEKVELNRLDLRHYRPLADCVLLIRAGKKEYHTIVLTN